MDSRNQMLCGYYAFEEYKFARASLELLLKNIHDDKHLPLTAPSRRALTIPSFTLVYFLQVYEYVKHSGDIDFFRVRQQQLSEILQAFLSRIESNGLIANFTEQQYWNFYEWTEDMDGDFMRESQKRYECPLNAFLVIALDSFARCAELAGLADAQKFSQIAEDINNAIFAEFYDTERQMFFSFSDGERMFSQLTNSLALLANPKMSFYEDLCQKLACGSDMSGISLSMMIYKYQALLGAQGSYEDYIIEDIRRIWGKMLFDGATSFYETEDGGDAFNFAGSLSHGWSALPVYFYHKLALTKDL